jgi:hypothetical protein
MKILKSIFYIKNLAGVFYCIRIPLLGLMKFPVSEGNSLGTENGNDVLARKVRG